MDCGWKIDWVVCTHVHGVMLLSRLHMIGMAVPAGLLVSAGALLGGTLALQRFGLVVVCACLKCAVCTSSCHVPQKLVMCGWC
jgi:hypothetical protein